MPLHAIVRYPRPDVDRTTDEIHRVMSNLAVDAAKTFVFATTDIIPVLTGGTKASFLKLASQVKLTLTINPVKASRIQLGIDSSTGEVFAERGRIYGFNWTSDLFYIHYVDARFAFVERGVQAVRAITPTLPAPIILSSSGH